ncbi:DUF2249 domain-containing protein [Thermithiobacillus plumbiphilus]|uniref:DUF2249 domain-containing protein n=1 Tax=Thermithiobacillus plumbiphilus TaxID=1729899 RepID=A0ABU9D844_9PROT
MDKEQLLDVRELEPPEPLQAVLNTLATLSPRQRLRVIHHREPYPLYPILDQWGLTYETRQHTPDHYEILIWHPDVI